MEELKKETFKKVTLQNRNKAPLILLKSFEVTKNEVIQ